MTKTMTESNSSSNDRIFLQFLGFLNTPELWEDHGYFEYTQFKLEGAGIDHSPTAADLPESMVLGKRMEYFFRYFITHFSRHELLAANEQIIADKVTLGELDFLLKDPSGEVQHVELVYKFYIYDPSIVLEEERWIGPNRRDSLVKKLRRLNTRQFPLLYRKETLPLLEKLQVEPQGIFQKVCFKAFLFVPRKLLHIQLPLVNPDCIRGFWIRRSEFTESDFGENLFYSPRKPDWPINPRRWTKWYRFDEINRQVNSLLGNERAPLIWMKTEQNEFFRFFVVWW